MRRRNKVLIAMGVIGASALLIAFNTTAESGPKALGVSEAKRDHAALGGRPVAVRGVVENITTNGTMVAGFLLTEGDEKLFVDLGQPAPENFGPSKDVVVYGTLSTDPFGAVRLAATGIQVGCSSKY